MQRRARNGSSFQAWRCRILPPDWWNSRSVNRGLRAWEGSGGAHSVPRCGWIPTTELAVGKSAPDACLVPATGTHFSKLNKKQVKPISHCRRCIAVLAIQQFTVWTPGLAQSTLRDFPRPENEYICKLYQLFDRQRGFKEFQRASDVAVGEGPGVPRDQPSVGGDHIVSSYRRTHRLADGGTSEAYFHEVATGDTCTHHHEDNHA